MFCQLGHPGRNGWSIYSKLPQVSSADIPSSINLEMPKKTEPEDIDKLIQAPADAAVRAYKGGFEGAESGAAYLSNVAAIRLSGERMEAERKRERGYRQVLSAGSPAGGARRGTQPHGQSQSMMRPPAAAISKDKKLTGAVGERAPAVVKLPFARTCPARTELIRSQTGRRKSQPR